MAARSIAPSASSATSNVYRCKPTDGKCEAVTLEQVLAAGTGATFPYRSLADCERRCEVKGARRVLPDELSRLIGSMLTLDDVKEQGIADEAGVTNQMSERQELTNLYKIDKSIVLKLLQAGYGRNSIGDIFDLIVDRMGYPDDVDLQIIEWFFDNAERLMEEGKEPTMLQSVDSQSAINLLKKLLNFYALRSAYSFDRGQGDPTPERRLRIKPLIEKVVEYLFPQSIDDLYRLNSLENYASVVSISQYTSLMRIWQSMWKTIADKFLLLIATSPKSNSKNLSNGIESLINFYSQTVCAGSLPSPEQEVVLHAIEDIVIASGAVNSSKLAPWKMELQLLKLLDSQHLLTEEEVEVVERLLSQNTGKCMVALMRTEDERRERYIDRIVDHFIRVVLPSMTSFPTIDSPEDKQLKRTIDRLIASRDSDRLTQLIANIPPALERQVRDRIRGICQWSSYNNQAAEEVCNAAGIDTSIARATGSNPFAFMSMMTGSHMGPVPTLGDMFRTVDTAPPAAARASTFYDSFRTVDTAPPAPAFNFGTPAAASVSTRSPFDTESLDSDTGTDDSFRFDLRERKMGASSIAPTFNFGTAGSAPIGSAFALAPPAGSAPSFNFGPYSTAGAPDAASRLVSAAPAAPAFNFGSGSSASSGPAWGGAPYAGFRLTSSAPAAATPTFNFGSQ